MKHFTIALAIIIASTTSAFSANPFIPSAMSKTLIANEETKTVDDIVHNFYVRYYGNSAIPAENEIIEANNNANLYRYTEGIGTEVIGKTTRKSKIIKGQMIVDNLVYYCVKKGICN